MRMVYFCLFYIKNDNKFLYVKNSIKVEKLVEL